MLLIASRTLSQGRGAGFATLNGIMTGTYCQALAAAFGLSQLFLAASVAVAGDDIPQGLMTNLFNPKMALFVLALFPQFVQPQVGSVALQILLMATVLNAIGFMVNGAVILTASRLGRGQQSPPPSAALFVGLGAAGLGARGPSVASNG